MSDQPPLSAAASLLRPFVNAVLTHVSRLRAERQADRMLAIKPTDLMENILNETLGRLRGGSIEDAWWRNILAQFGQQYISPDFLKKPALQEWLSDEQVANDLKLLATTQILAGTADDTDIRTRLVLSYSENTGEADQLAKGPIDVVVAILVAGYIASISSDQRPIAGMVQGVSKQVSEVSEKLNKIRSSALTDPITQQTHTKEAAQELDKILMLRAFDPPRARLNIQGLWHRVGDEGDLVAVSTSIKNKVLYWTARLCASDAATRDSARQLRHELLQADPNMDLSIIDALLAETGGDANEALRLLRDNDDPDSRTALFGVLAQLRGERDALAWSEDQNASNDSQFFTAVGWKIWAVFMAKIGKWEEAAQRLISFEALWPEMPALAFVEGIINAAMLLPDDHREMALKTVPIFQGVAPSLVAGAENRHSRAVACFEFVEQSLKDIADHDLARFISDWCLWLQLMDPKTENANAARDEIRQYMEEGARAVELIPFAYAFDISFNVEPLRQYLEQRKQIGGLNEHELLAEGLLSKQSMSPRDLVAYLEQHRTRLSKVMHPALVTTMHVDALVRDGQTERARTVVAEHAADLGEEYSNRLTVMIDAEEGNDPREQLEHLYREKGHLYDLKNLISYLKTVDDRASLQPLVRDLFDRQRTVGNACDVVMCLAAPSSFDYGSIIEFLEANPDLLEQSDDLRAAKAWALFHASRLQESREINDILLNKRTNQDDFRLDINIAICSGDWERVAAIIDREWDRRDSHDPEMLMNLARLAGQQGQSPDRALQLAKLAAQKAPEEPGILAAAYCFHFQLGRDDEADPDWLMRASELSSADEGPLWPVDLQDLVTKWLPKRQEHLREVERKWLNGEIPMSLVENGFNMPLSRLLLHIPAQNTNELDGRRRIILPIIAGARNPIELQENWTIGLDVTSIMILTHLDLLEKAFGVFHHVKLAPDTMEYLLRERDAVRFHQPSRIAAAKQVRDLQGRRYLRAADNLAASPEIITDEVGFELAALLQMARRDNGKVICVLPIQRASSLMEQQADTSEFDDLILSTMDICTLLYSEGKIDAVDYQRARLFLNHQGQPESASFPPSVLNGPIYMDRLALTYLQHAKILQPIAAAGLDVRIHPDVLDEMNALIEACDVGDELVTEIEGIRNILRNALDSGAVSFLPRAPDQDKRIQKHETQFQATASLLAGSAACDALCIDDRCINSHPNFTDDTGQLVPIVCVLDVLRHLLSRGVIDVPGHWEARHKLRRSGFAFIPIESDELMHWLTAAKVDDGQMTESAELRILRQTMANIDFQGLSSLEEAATLSTNLDRICKTAIDRVWEDASFTVEQAGALSDWVWHHLMKTAVLAREQIAADNRADWVRDLISLRLGYLLMPMTIQSEERRAQFADWIEQSVLEPLRPANAALIEKALATMCDKISALEDHHEVYGNLFLEQLPSSARKVVISKNPEFSERCGFKTESVLEIGTEIKLAESKLVEAVREVFAKGAEKTIQDTSGKDVSISVDRANQNIVVTWTDSEGTSQHASLRELAILSPSQ